MPNSEDFPYVTRTNVYYKPLELVDEKALADACMFKWYNQTLCQVNNSVIRLGVFEGEYHWHKHDNDDEFFYVVEGKLLIDLKDQAIPISFGHLHIWNHLRPRRGLPMRCCSSLASISATRNRCKSRFNNALTLEPNPRHYFRDRKASSAIATVFETLFLLSPDYTVVSICQLFQGQVQSLAPVL